MTDRELLEMAAKAAAYEIKEHPNRKFFGDLLFIYRRANWNPLADDGDALRLAVELKFEIFCGEDQSEVKDYEQTFVIIEEHKDHESPVSATRRAIVRAAAEIGKEMP